MARTRQKRAPQAARRAVKAKRSIAPRVDGGGRLGRKGTLGVPLVGGGAGRDSMEGPLPRRNDALDVLTQSSAIMAHGLEDLGRAWLGLVQSSLLDGAAIARAMARARSMREVLDLQHDYVHAVLSKMIGEGGRISGLSLDVAGRAMRPIQARMSATLAMLSMPAEL